MNEIVKVYKNSPVRIVEKGGEPWFVARDVCKVLEITKVDSAIRNLDADEKGAHTVSTPGGNQEMTIVSEAGLYSLILRSRKPEAKAFKRWVTHEVLPSIRKTGAYLSPGMSNEQVKALVATLEEEMYRRIQAENRLAKLEAHAEELARAAIPATPFGAVWRNWRLMPRSWRDRPFRQHPLENFLRKPADRVPVWFGITSGAVRK